MGHAGALIGSERETAAAKLAALREAGAHTVATPYDAIPLLRDLLAQ
jgi:succinyl-CoA synthetase alpha subunit